MKEQFCTYCGYVFINDKWPRVCGHCEQLTWRNPEPVGVGLVPIKNGEQLGLLLVKRSIPPIGGLALPGGFMEYHESWQKSISRELFEETNVVVSAENFTLFDVKSSTHNGKLLVFGICPPQDVSVLQGFKINDEVSEILVVYQPCDLCFPLQTDALKRWFDER